MTVGRIIISSSNLGYFAPSSPSEPASHVQYSAFVSEFVQVVKVWLQEVQVSGGVKSLLHLFLTAKACTEIRVTTEDNSTVVIGRSMEWSSDIQSDIIVEPQGYFHEVNLSVYCTNTDHAGAPLQNWTNRYTVIYLNAFGLDVASGGMNSEELTVGALYLPDFTKYQVHI